jgi:hypothetical protein
VDEDNAEDTEVITVWVKAGWLEDDGDVEGEDGEEADDVMETGVDKMAVGGCPGCVYWQVHWLSMYLEVIYR